MKGLLAGAILALATGSAAADAFIMGSGRWTCGQALQAWQGKPIDKGQVAGWILGYWSAVTASRDKSFVDTVEKVGGLKIVELTLRECEKAGADVPLYRITQGMIANTK